MTDDASSAPTLFDLQPDPDKKIQVGRVQASCVRASGCCSMRAAATSCSPLRFSSSVGWDRRAARDRTAGAPGAARRCTPGRVGDVDRSVGLAGQAVSTVLFIASSIQRERQELLGEVVARYVEERLLDVATKVDLIVFDDPDFHNRLERARSARNQPMNLVFGVSASRGRPSE